MVRRRSSRAGLVFVCLLGGLVVYGMVWLAAVARPAAHFLPESLAQQGPPVTPPNPPTPQHGGPVAPGLPLDALLAANAASMTRNVPTMPALPVPPADFGQRESDRHHGCRGIRAVHARRLLYGFQTGRLSETISSSVSRKTARSSGAPTV